MCDDWYQVGTIRALAELVAQGISDERLLRVACAYEVARP